MRENVSVLLEYTLFRIYRMATENSVFEYRAKKNIDKEKENQVPNAVPFQAKLKLLVIVGVTIRATF